MAAVNTPEVLPNRTSLVCFLASKGCDNTVPKAFKAQPPAITVISSTEVWYDLASNNSDNHCLVKSTITTPSTPKQIVQHIHVHKV